MLSLLNAVMDVIGTGEGVDSVELHTMELNVYL